MSAIDHHRPLTRTQRIWRNLRPTRQTETGPGTRPERFVELFEAAWREAGFPQVRAWLGPDKELCSNLKPNGLPPDVPAGWWS